MKSETFRMKRFIRLVCTELRLNATGIAFGAAALFCVLTARWLLFGSLIQDRFIAVDYGFFLLTGGLVLASLAFVDLADSAKAQAFLTIPASRLEKYLSRYLLTSWLTAAGGLAVYGIFFLMVSGLHAAFPDVVAAPSDPLNRTLFRATLYFLILHPAFFLGSLYFRRLAFPKTIITIVLFSFLLWLFTSGLARLLFRDFLFIPREDVFLFSSKWTILPGYLSYPFFTPFLWFWHDWPVLFFKWWPFSILPFLFLLTGYYRFSETETSHGIS
jgi:hypothetical protein